MSVINLDEVGTLCLPSCLTLRLPTWCLMTLSLCFLSPFFTFQITLNMVSSLCKRVADGAGAAANNQKPNACCHIQWKKMCWCNGELRNKREHVSLDMFPAYFFTHTGGRDSIFCYHCELQKSEKVPCAQSHSYIAENSTCSQVNFTMQLWKLDWAKVRKTQKNTSNLRILQRVIYMKVYIIWNGVWGRP